ncbi:DUF1566 domain-containing protein [Candidatus Binatia bacterium]|nr:DUF1566 domain-containing protein [Candidatus Binatia bacterium]
MRASLVSLGVATGAALTLWSGVALAATDEQKCLSGRAKAKGKYEKCIEDQLGRVYGPKSPNWAKCRIKYDKVWTKLQGLIGSGTCGGVARYVDNGNGTVTDNLTGLVWEKKTTAVGSGTDFPGDRHDVDNYYTWTSSGVPPYAENGTAYTDFLENLNAGGGFADSNGWRLPTFAELQTILLPEEYPCTTSPCIPATFGSTQSSGYWSATTLAGFPDVAWGVGFADGGVLTGFKTFGGYARAVRGGL